MKFKSQQIEDNVYEDNKEQLNYLFDSILECTKDYLEINVHEINTSIFNVRTTEKDNVDLKEYMNALEDVQYYLYDSEKSFIDTVEHFKDSFIHQYAISRLLNTYIY